MHNSTLSALVAVTAVTAGLALTGCSPAATGGDARDGQTTVTFRLWDESVAAAYEESFDAFEADNPDINVELELVPWADYWTKLPVDIASGTMADIYWTNAANYAVYVDNGNLINVTDEVGEGDWVQSVVDLYTRDGSLWGVPQLWDSIAMFYNEDLIEAADVDPTELRWDPSGADDTFLDAARRLTVDEAGIHADEPGFDADHIEQYAFNAQYDLQAIVADFVGSNGGSWIDGDEYVFDSPEGAAAIRYLTELITTHHVSPSAADTNDNGNLARELFAAGNLALFQSGPYSLRPIADNTDVNWKVVPMLEGPAGRVSVVHGVVAVGNSATSHRDATVRVLEWLGSEAGQLPIAESGAAFPGVNGAQQAFVDYWAEEGVDVTAFIDAANGTTTNTGSGIATNAADQAAHPIFTEVLLGRLDPDEGTARAADAANAAVQEALE